MNSRVEYLVGRQSDNEWSGLYWYRPEETKEIELFAVMRMTASADNSSLDRIAKLLLDELQTSFFDVNDKESDLIIRLENSVWKMKSKMDFLLSREQEIAQNGLDIEFAIGVNFEGFLYLGVVGESKIILKRNDKLVEVSKALVDSNMTGFLKSGSLELDPDDRILLLTSKVDEDQDLINKTLENLNLSYFEKEKEKVGVSVIVFADESLNWNIQEEPEVVDNVQATQSNLLDNNELLDSEANEVDEEGIANPTLNTQVNSISKRFASGIGNVKNRFNQIREERAAKNDSQIEEIIDDINTPRFSDIQEESSEEELEMQIDSQETASVARERVGKIANNLQSGLSSNWQNKVKPGVSSLGEKVKELIKVVSPKVKSLLNRVYNFIKNEIIGTGDRRDMYLKGRRRSRNRKILAVVTVILLIFIYVSLRNAETNRIEQERIEAARTKTEEFRTQFNTLSSQVSSARGSGEQTIVQLLNRLNSLKGSVNTQKSSGLFETELNSLTNSIDAEVDELLQVESLTNPTVVTDIGAIYSDTKLSDIEYSNGSLFISDSARNVIYRVPSNSNNVRPEIYITELDQPYLLTRDASGNIVFFDNDAASAIGRFGYSQPSLTRFAQLGLGDVGNPKEIAIYDGNNAIYEIRSNNNQIYKRDVSGESYVGGGALPSTDPASDWRTDADYANAIDIAAPYELYVLIKGQGVKRYFARNDNTIAFETYNNLLQQDFDALKQASSIGLSTRFMAVGDPVNKRVVLFQIEETEEKKLTFIKQFVYKGSESIFNDINEVVINEEQREIYVLDAARVIRLQF
jgi:type II secretory pathway pseudopilin PulG